MVNWFLQPLREMMRFLQKENTAGSGWAITERQRGTRKHLRLAWDRRK